MDLTEDTLVFILNELYANQRDAEFHAFHPRFLIDQCKAISAFEGVSPRLTPDFLARAWGNLFVED
ncbi:MAG: hypothetical protein OEN23_08210 [Paracoccaceae bacterium]|nr:hypothetical protein [Paracoccaceae bacterium]